MTTRRFSVSDTVVSFPDARSREATAQRTDSRELHYFRLLCNVQDSSDLMVFEPHSALCHCATGDLRAR
ncbi:hypothetical protein P167DRAFT_286382 [Morchella conica CCBAS932]|uniref:Uncharacterized protein n=2 Tax=Morchella sect. Distantes TaxID=1051054 RepID=A0A3N4KN73_9PEZI|nr:hypothetical protein P167DRAFT_286382 [Morchella conica CCBAS932]